MAEVKQFARLIIDEYKTAKTVDISPRWKLGKSSWLREHHNMNDECIIS